MPYYTYEIATGDIIGKQPDQLGGRNKKVSREGYARVHSEVDVRTEHLGHYEVSADEVFRLRPVQEILDETEKREWFGVRMARLHWFRAFDKEFDMATKDMNAGQQKKLLRLRQQAKDLTKDHATPDEAMVALKTLVP